MVVQHPKEATAVMRARFQSRDALWKAYCLNGVRTALGIDSKYASAKDAWKGAHRKHRFTNADAIPFGAPVFSDRPGGSQWGHIFLAGGRFKNGNRIFWTNDQHNDGRYTPVELDFFRQYWGHQVLGWSEDLNGVAIPFLED